MKTNTVHHTAQLASIPVIKEEEEELASAFEETLTVVHTLNEVDTAKVVPTHQVTGLTNMLREDIVDESRMFTQEEALSNAKQTHKGFFVVNQVIDQSQ